MEITISYKGEHNPKLDKQLEEAMKTIGFEGEGALYDLHKQIRNIDFVSHPADRLIREVLSIGGIDKIKWYLPMEVAENGWITTPRTKTKMGRYNFILKEVRAGRIKAQNYANGNGGMKYYKILGKDILNHINIPTKEKIQEYE